VIIEGDVILRKEGRYQVITNFYHSLYKSGNYPCSRYNTAVDMLESAPEISVDLFRDILDATHQSGRYPTQYSNVYDLRRGLVYVFHRHDYDRAVVIDLQEELEEGAHTDYLAALFAEPDPAPAAPLPDTGTATAGLWPLTATAVLMGAGLVLHWLSSRGSKNREGRKT
jgi:hypothetical protein